jgi:periplasmic protein TonB
MGNHKRGKGLLSVAGVSSGNNKNRVLGITLILSILIHGLILIRMTGIFHETSFIELSLKQEFKPLVRNIPQPPIVKKKEAQPKMIEPEIGKITEIPQVPLTPVPLPLVVPKDFIPFVQDIAPPPVHFPTPIAPPAKKATKFSSAQDYFQMVRMKIESQKQYPRSARRQNLTGRVTVKFIIEPDGSISSLNILKKSKFKSLNQAALNAIKNSAPFPGPPPAYFKGALPIQLSIIFDLN